MIIKWKSQRYGSSTYNVTQEEYDGVVEQLLDPAVRFIAFNDDRGHWVFSVDDIDTVNNDG